MDPQISLEPQADPPVTGKMKALDPLTSAGPSSPIVIVQMSDTEVEVLAAHQYFPRTLVQIIYSHQVMMGEVVVCEPFGDEFSIRVKPVTLT